MSSPYPHIETPAGNPAHLRRLPRIRVAQIVMDYLFHGWSVDEMCRHHPYLTPAEAHAAMAYYFDHQMEVENEIQREVAQEKQERAQAQPSAFALRMQLRQKTA